jgi:hypothetical protein
VQVGVNIRAEMKAELLRQIAEKTLAGLHV